MWIIGGFNLSKNINELIYPIGSIYISVNNTNPSILFGGKWEQIKDTFILAAGDNYDAGQIGGAATHTLTLDEMPAHWHKTVTQWNGRTCRIKYYQTNASNGGAWTLLSPDTSTNSYEYEDGAIYAATEGGNQPHNNMPPYLTVYMWKRVQ